MGSLARVDFVNCFLPLAGFSFSYRFSVGFVPYCFHEGSLPEIGWLIFDEHSLRFFENISRIPISDVGKAAKPARFGLRRRS